MADMTGPRSLSDLLVPIFRSSPKSRTCPTCGAKPGQVCVLVRGPYKGTYASGSHAARRGRS